LKTIKVASIAVAPLLITSLFLIGVTASEYDPWYDFDDDGDIDIFDIVDIETDTEPQEHPSTKQHSCWN